MQTLVDDWCSSIFRTHQSDSLFGNQEDVPLGRIADSYSGFRSVQNDFEEPYHPNRNDENELDFYSEMGSGQAALDAWRLEQEEETHDLANANDNSSSTDEEAFDEDPPATKNAVHNKQELQDDELDPENKSLFSSDSRDSLNRSNDHQAKTLNSSRTSEHPRQEESGDGEYDTFYETDERADETIGLTEPSEQDAADTDEQQALSLVTALTGVSMLASPHKHSTQTGNVSPHRDHHNSCHHPTHPHQHRPK